MMFMPLRRRRRLSLLASPRRRRTRSRAGRRRPAFTLDRYRTARRVKLADFKGKTVVLEWTNHACPFVQKHYGSGNMQTLQKRVTGHGVVWLTINSSAPGTPST